METLLAPRASAPPPAHQSCAGRPSSRIALAARGPRRHTRRSRSAVFAASEPEQGASQRGALPPEMLWWGARSRASPRFSLLTPPALFTRHQGDDDPPRFVAARAADLRSPPSLPDEATQRAAVQSFLYPDPEELPDDSAMSIWDHLEELRSRAAVSAGAVAALVLASFAYSKQLVLFLEQPVAQHGVRFLQLAPGEYFFTTVKVAGYTGLLLGAPVVLYEIIAFVVPGLTRSERRFLAPIVIGSSVLFYGGLAFSYAVLAPAALNFFVTYADSAVESLWSIDQYFEFVLVLMLSTGLSFQVPVIQMLLGATGLVSATQMFAVWRYVVVGATVAAAVLTPSTDPFTQGLLALPLIGLYFGGAAAVAFIEKGQNKGPWATGEAE